MLNKAVNVENLCKAYKISHKAEREDTLRDYLSRRFSKVKSHKRRDTTELFYALDDISFQVKEGEVLGIIGHNGAGKSTLLKILSRITDPTSGRVEIRGRVASLLEVGTGFHPELTGRENIYLNGAVLGMSREEIRKNFDEIVDFSGVETFLDTPVKRYSSGMYVRLAFAIAAHLEPEILVIDEVLAVGDQEFQKKCLGKMKSVSTTEGRTVIFVSHQFPAVSQLCDRALLFDHGKIAYEGDVPEALQRAMKTSNLEPASSKNTQTARVTSVEIDPNSLSRGDLTITIRFQSPFALQKPHVGLTITTALGMPVTATNTTVDPPKNSGPTKRGALQATWHHPPLISGIYRLNIWFGDGKGDLDYLDGVKDFYFEGTNQRPPDFTPDRVGPLDASVQWSQLD